MQLVPKSMKSQTGQHNYFSANRTVLQKPSPVKTTLHNTPLTPSVFLHEDNELVTPSTSVVRTPRSRNLFDPKSPDKNDGSLKEMMQNMSNMLQAIYTEVNELKSDMKILKTTLTTKETDKIIEDLIPNPIATEGDLNALNRKLAESSFRTKFLSGILTVMFPSIFHLLKYYRYLLIF
ncbi:uncharacterized protein [Procambarus clarkii]|uniref:uncharacterized protein n=1 Tax=Procambarus clarkii TaxID=6728 RepID=UPI003743C7C8